MSGNIIQKTCPKCGERHLGRECPTCRHRAPKIDYRRVRHAVHTLYNRQPGWDLEIWDVDQAFEEPRPDGVPADAEKHSGSICAGVERTRFVRRAPMSPGLCEFCDTKSGQVTTVTR